MTIKGLKVGQIMEMTYDDLKGLETKELKEVASRLFSATNKRLKRLERASNVTSPAIIGLMKSRGATSRTITANGAKIIHSVPKKFSRAGKSKSELISEINSARAFMERRTSSVSGAKAFMRETEKRIGGKFETPEQSSEFWANYRRFMQSESSLVKSFKDGSMRVQQLLREQFVEEKRDWGTIFDDVRERLDEEYRDEQTRLDEMLNDDWD